MNHLVRRRNLLLAGVVLACAFVPVHAQQVAPSDSLVGLLSSRLGITQNQAWRGLGALLAFAQDRLHTDEYERVAAAIPNSQAMLDLVKQQGFVTGPLDGADEYREVLENLRITGAAQERFAPAVQAWLRHVGAFDASDMLGKAFY